MLLITKQPAIAAALAVVILCIGSASTCAGSESIQIAEDALLSQLGLFPFPVVVANAGGDVNHDTIAMEGSAPAIVAGLKLALPHSSVTTSPESVLTWISLDFQARKLKELTVPAATPSVSVPLMEALNKRAEAINQSQNTYYFSVGRDENASQRLRGELFTDANTTSTMFEFLSNISEQFPDIRFALTAKQTPEKAGDVVGYTLVDGKKVEFARGPGRWSKAISGNYPYVVTITLVAAGRLAQESSMEALRRTARAWLHPLEYAKLMDSPHAYVRRLLISDAEPARRLGELLIRVGDQEFRNETLKLDASTEELASAPTAHLRLLLAQRIMAVGPRTPGEYEREVLSALQAVSSAETSSGKRMLSNRDLAAAIETLGLAAHPAALELVPLLDEGAGLGKDVRRMVLGGLGHLFERRGANAQVERLGAILRSQNGSQAISAAKSAVRSLVQEIHNSADRATTTSAAPGK